MKAKKNGLPVWVTAIPAAVAVTAVVMGLIYYFTLPAITLESGGFWWFGLIAIAIIMVIMFGKYLQADDDNTEKVGKRYSITYFVIVVLFIIMGFASSEMLNARSYQAIMSIEEAEFQDNFADITETEQPIAIIDLETAKIVGNRTIGNIQNSSWYEVDDEFNLIKYQGKYYRISALNYGGFFKYNKAKDYGIPGFVLVDAETGEAQFVKVEGGYFYSPSAYWSKYLERHLQTTYTDAIMNNSYFEIDEEGNPYWITPVYRSTVGLFGARKQVAIILTDAVTGATKRYAMDSIPEWIDHAYSLDYLTSRTQYHYCYVNGYWNDSIFGSKTGVYNLAYTYRNESKKVEGGYFEGYTSVIGQDGEVYFYSGLTPANSVESNFGFVMMNTRTGQVTQYKYRDDTTAAEEKSAQDACESLVQNFGYQATFPIIVNVGGQSTYLMTLKDKACLVQRYALCNIQNYSIVVEAETMESAVNKYLGRLNNETVEEIDESEVQSSSGVIEEVYTAQLEGTTFFYYKFEDDAQLYKASIFTSERQVTLKPGNRINFDYVKTGDIFTITQLEIK